jgi:hypothetical protein
MAVPSLRSMARGPHDLRPTPSPAGSTMPPFAAAVERPVAGYFRVGYAGWESAS